MGTLIRFSPKAPRQRSLPPRQGGKSADIVLFTGIRYERGPETTLSGPERRARRRRKG